MLQLDGTDNKGKLGANAILAVSMACARAAANALELPLYRYLGGVNACLLPTPMMNILNGGAHADNNVDFQEFMVMPVGAESFSDALRWGAEVFHTLKGVLKKKGYNTAVGDEGGFAPSLKSNVEAIEVILEAIEAAGYTAGEDIAHGARSRGQRVLRQGNRQYVFKKSDKSEKTSDRWPLLGELGAAVSHRLLEDGLAEDDWDGWRALTAKLGRTVQLVGDDLFVTNTEVSAEGIERAWQLHPDQGQPDRHRHETLEAIELARRHGYTLDHLAPLRRNGRYLHRRPRGRTGAGQIKTGSARRTDRIAKYNQLLRIEEELGQGAEFLGIAARSTAESSCAIGG